MINWHLYPYTDLHEMNLDWIIDDVKELDQRVDDIVSEITQEVVDISIVECKAYIDEQMRIVLDDMADLFSEDEEERLFRRMAQCSWGGSVFLVTTENDTYGDASDYAEAYYVNCISGQSGVIFLIDMDTRKLMLYSDGAYGRDLTVGIMHIITDNVYKRASNGDYYGCADEAFSQVSDVLEGKRIAAPMKYASNACLAVLLALTINYFFARGVSKMSAPSDSELVDSMKTSFLWHQNLKIRLTCLERILKSLQENVLKAVQMLNQSFSISTLYARLKKSVTTASAFLKV